MNPLFLLPVVFVLFLVFRWINVLNEYERGVVFRLGRVLGSPKGPGVIFIFWPLDRMVKVSLRTVVHDVPSQDVITKETILMLGTDGELLHYLENSK